MGKGGCLSQPGLTLSVHPPEGRFLTLCLWLPGLIAGSLVYTKHCPLHEIHRKDTVRGECVAHTQIKNFVYAASLGKRITRQIGSRTNSTNNKERDNT
ncbi:hypothetical protein CEXT_313121 [Caerostris extrusa]|uniref:Secreted protein n=1 Tax=Caerostris extrusa TaxID=172846 RepID=A0AAV4MC83_CAEEX|nr:hypothetical protein CEXT_313121 [Caerostris extrusa]